MPKIELDESVYQQIERVKEANLYYEGYERLIQRLRNNIVRGKASADRDELNKVAEDILDAHHRLVNLLDYPHDLHVPDETSTE